MNSLRKNTQNSPLDIIIDTNTLFSALYNPDGNEAHLLELADRGRCYIHLLDYVLDEIEAVFDRKGIDFDLVTDLLDTYNHLYISELEDLRPDEVKLARQNIDDASDRPIFIFAYRRISRDENVFFISGDQGFFDEEVVQLLDGRVLTTREMIEKIEEG